MTTYLLDANVFITAKNTYYGLDFHPGFWDWLIWANSENLVFSVERVGIELKKGGDPLAKWAASRGPNFFVKPDSKVQTAFNNVSQWVLSRNYKPASINTFFNGADYYLVAQALAHKHTVISLEVTDKARRNNVKIPDVCSGLGVKCIQTHDMLRKESVRFAKWDN